MRIEMATGALTKGLETVSKMGKGLFLELFKVYAIGILVILLGVGVAVLAASVISSTPWVSITLIIAAVIAAVLLSTGIMTVPMNIIDERISKSPALGIMGNAKRNILPAAAFYIIMILIISIFAYAPLFVGMKAGGTALVAAYIYYYFAVFVISFLFQFGVFELVVSRSGALGSFGKSFGIVKRNFWETLVYYIGMCGVSIAAALIMGIILLVLFLVPAIIGFMVASAAGSQVLSLALLALGIIYAITLYIAYTAAMEAVVLPIQYFYWKAAREAR